MTTLLRDFSLGLWYYSMSVKIHFYLIRAFILSNMILLNFVTGYMYSTINVDPTMLHYVNEYFGKLNQDIYDKIFYSIC